MPDDMRPDEARPEPPSHDETNDQQLKERAESMTERVRDVHKETDLPVKPVEAEEEQDWSLPDSPSTEELDEKIDAIQQRAKTAKKGYEASQAKAAEGTALGRDGSRGLGIGITSAFALIVSPLMGYGAGYLIDRSLGGGNLFGVLGLAGGLVLGIFFVTRASKRL